MNVGTGAFEWEKLNVRGMLEDYISRLKSDGTIGEEPVKTPNAGGRIPLGGPVKRFVYDRAMLAGDCAGMVSPVSGEGIYYAIESGRMAAQTAVDALRRGDRSQTGLAGYQRALDAAHGRELRFHRYLRSMFGLMPEMFFQHSKDDPVIRQMVFDVFVGKRSARNVIPFATRFWWNVLRFQVLRWRPKPVPQVEFPLPAPTPKPLPTESREPVGV
jgi:flavin-dependent dehydrogenase